MKENITIIESYERLPFSKYLAIEEIAGRQYNEEIDRQMEILSVLTGADIQTLGDLLISDYRALVEKAAFLEGDCDKAEVADVYNLGGFELVPVKDFKEITAAQYIDFETFAKQGNKAAIEMLSCMMVPKGHKYNRGYDVIAVQKALREELMTPDAVALLTFFFKSWGSSIVAMLSSLELRAKMEKGAKAEMLMKRAQELKEVALLLAGDGYLA